MKIYCKINKYAVKEKYKAKENKIVNIVIVCGNYDLTHTVAKTLKATVMYVK